MSLSNSRGTSLGFRASTCLLASAAIVPGSGANARPDRANVVFMLADDLATAACRSTAVTSRLQMSTLSRTTASA